jgi:SAM-dependent methyltransferase
MDYAYTDYRDTNRNLWNGWARFHVRSAFYDVPAFKAGKSSLMPIEMSELGSVIDKSLLHLQCHFGMDTLSWARLGARVTGVDLADEAIRLARQLSSEIDVPARFIRSDIYELPAILRERFDIVFTSYGVLCWLDDLERWARVVAHFLKPGGVFYMVEFHPVWNMLDEKDGTRVCYDYFSTPEPERFEEQGSYADRTAEFRHPGYAWAHGLGEIITALISAGLRVEYLHEFPYSVYNVAECLEESAPGMFTVRGRNGTIPLLFSLRAHLRGERSAIDE